MKLAGLLLFTAALAGCGPKTPPSPVPVVSATVVPAFEAPEIPRPLEPDYLSLVAAGDNLFHDRMFNPVNGTYPFDAYYRGIKFLIRPADIAFINQETVLGEPGSTYSGYPLFNTPQALGDTLIGVGFDVVNQATNHIMDQGERGVLATMDYWDAHPEVSYLGIHRTKGLRETPYRIVERNNIRLGFLSYTFGTNGLPLPAGKPWMVSLIDTELMAREIDALRPLCDFLIVSMHWGEEYRHLPTARQRELAAFLATHYVDMVLGHHPHVIEPIEYVPRPDGGTMLCYYSLGNFLSAQNPANTLLGGLAYIRLQKTYAPASISIIEAGVIPTVTHYEAGYTNFQVYPFFRYTEALAKKHFANALGNPLSRDYFTKLVEEIFGPWILRQDPFKPQQLLHYQHPNR
jgi:poly-gamma-glutamate synthesis protein (capsule biosynthesis protein)